MKKFNSTHALAMLALTSFLGLTSCEKDAFDNEATTPATQEAKCELSASDSVFVNTTAFDYGNGGPSSIEQTIGAPDYAICFDLPNKLATRSVVADDVIMTGAQKIFEFVTEEAFAFAFDQATNSIYEDIFGDEEAMEITKQLTKTNQMVSAINEDLVNIEIRLNHNASASVMTERQRYNSLITWTIQQYKNLCDARNDAEKCDSIVRKWGNQTSVSSNAYLSAIECLKFFGSKDNSLKLYLPQVYDYWVYQSTAWEHEGLTRRANMRAVDVSVASTLYLMTKAYCALEGKNASSTSADEAFKQVRKVYEYFDAIPKHSESLICQLKGCNVIISKKAVTRYMETHPWMRQGTKWDNVKDFMYGEMGHEGYGSDYVVEHSLKKEEAEKILNYFNSGNKNYTMSEILDLLGFDMSTLDQGKNRRLMVFADGCDKKSARMFQSNFNMTYNWVMDVDKKKDCFMQNFNIGELWLERAWNLSQILQHWHNYNCGNDQLFRLEVQRYNGEKDYLIPVNL